MRPCQSVRKHRHSPRHFQWQSLYWQTNHSSLPNARLHRSRSTESHSYGKRVPKCSHRFPNRRKSYCLDLGSALSPRPAIRRTHSIHPPHRLIQYYSDHKSEGLPPQKNLRTSLGQSRDDWHKQAGQAWESFQLPLQSI